MCCIWIISGRAFGRRTNGGWSHVCATWVKSSSSRVFLTGHHLLTHDNVLRWDLCVFGDQQNLRQFQPSEILQRVGSWYIKSRNVSLCYWSSNETYCCSFRPTFSFIPSILAREPSPISVAPIWITKFDESNHDSLVVFGDINLIIPEIHPQFPPEKLNLIWSTLCKLCWYISTAAKISKSKHSLARTRPDEKILVLVLFSPEGVLRKSHRMDISAVQIHLQNAISLIVSWLSSRKILDGNTATTCMRTNDIECCALDVSSAAL